MSKGFTLVELIIVVLVIGGILSGGWYYLNPLELKKRENDSLRLADLAELTQLITRVSQEASISGTPQLCLDESICSGQSNDGGSENRSVNGKGWVKVDLSSQRALSLPVLPLDPLNDANFFYRFHSDSVGWEIDAVLESEFFRGKMKSDGGNNDQKYEVGTNLTLLN